jgi:hypothetical protein
LPTGRFILNDPTCGETTGIRVGETQHWGVQVGLMYKRRKQCGSFGGASYHAGTPVPHIGTLGLFRQFPSRRAELSQARLRGRSVGFASPIPYCRRDGSDHPGHHVVPGNGFVLVSACHRKPNSRPYGTITYCDRNIGFVWRLSYSCVVGLNVWPSAALSDSLISHCGGPIMQPN